ncbi:hypothetical protein RF11_00732 [Thelohanellus kitauei]|uniref:Uncharacterized protein n=1 Tax=Thelohanellus kitauei TaxID=669202 RepID=A0A0C2JGB7_THEKT|nr:hypothetical protein RF11_06284 [Thelohanellus kitauei]KII74653.1 hypothetical protein RF11_00732 [Thelohanellus kitauei]
MNIEKYKEDIVTTSEEEVQTSDDLNTKPLQNWTIQPNLIRFYEYVDMIGKNSGYLVLRSKNLCPHLVLPTRWIILKVDRTTLKEEEVVMLENDEGYRMYLSIVTNIDEKLSLLLGCTLSDE